MPKNFIDIIFIVVLGGLIAFLFFGAPSPKRFIEAPYSTLIDKVNDGDVTEVRIDENDKKIYFKTIDGDMFATNAGNDSGLMNDLVDHGVKTIFAPLDRPGIGSVLLSWFPILLLIGVWIFFMTRNSAGSGGGSGALGFGKNKAKAFQAGEVNVKFTDVAGCDEAKEEVAEIVDFLRNPKMFTDIGGQIPRGILMVGPPGTGKTLLARAIAGEARVPFFSASGSDFVEMFVGVGASRVRDLFEAAKKNAPCIIFIDEIDAVGRKRGAGIGGGNDEREQTLNALLVEMDGFENNTGVIVIAASNRPDVLDKALLRPGRFDRQVTVSLPDVRGREHILNVHMRKIAYDNSVVPSTIARGTPGFSGADLANLVNEAALFAARARRKEVTMDDFERAKDKIMMGAERRSMVMSEKEKRMTAYHEAGHAIVGCIVPDHDPVHKVTIIPRGRALGVTMYLPEDDRVSYTKQYLESQLSSLYGGRIAEELIYGKDMVTTGASNDIERATQLATSMIKKWGFSDQLGPLAFVEEQGNGYLGQDYSSKDMAASTSELIDQEVKSLIMKNYHRAETILEERVDILHEMAEALVVYETINAAQVRALMNGAKCNEIAELDDGNDSDDSNIDVDGVTVEEKAELTSQ